MSEPFTFYRAADPVKGSWDGYGFFPLGDGDFLAFVTDAPSGASIHTPELIKNFWADYCRSIDTHSDPDFGRIILADGINRLQDFLQKRSHNDGTTYQATLSIARKLGATLHYSSIGDSVLQLLRDKRIYRLNENEVWDGALIVSENQIFKERQRTGDLRFVGEGGEFIEVSKIFQCELRPGDQLLFSTDGMEDILPPHQLLPLLNLKPEEMRRELEKIFTQDKLRDDVTFIALKVDVEPPFDAHKEVDTIREGLKNLRAEQTQFRNDLSRISVPQVKLEKLEKGLQQVAQQVQVLSRKIDSAALMRTSGATRRPNRAVWWFVLAAFLVGLGIGLGFYLSQLQHLKIPSAPIARSYRPVVPQKSVAPPEIPTAADCSYTVEKGDSLEKIAAKKKITLDTLLQLNPHLQSSSPLQVGQKLSVCKSSL